MNRLNWSTLKHIATSPRMLQWRLTHPTPDTDVLKFGRAFHCLILEPQEFDRRWTVAGPCAGVTKSGKVCGNQGSLYSCGVWYCKVERHAPTGAGDLPDGIESITSEQRETAKICAEQIKAHRVASETLRGGVREEALEWQIETTACRGRLDFLRPDYVADLKTTCETTPREFNAQSARMLYHGQLAWYHDAAIAAGRLPADAKLPRIVTVETVEPYDVAVYQFTAEALDAGRAVYRTLLARYRECVAAEYWPGHSPDLRYLDLPHWAIPRKPIARPNADGTLPPDAERNEFGDWAFDQIVAGITEDK